MRYLLGIYEDEARFASMSPEDTEAVMGAYYAFGDEAQKAGVLLAGEALQPTATATTVKVRDGEMLTTDGPFAETREQFGGYYLVECKDLDEAMQWASKIPGASTGSIEVRPVMEFDSQDHAQAGQPPAAAEPA
jgi:hypothetical protein